MKAPDNEISNTIPYRRPPLLMRLRAYLKSWTIINDGKKEKPEPFALHVVRAKAEADKSLDAYLNAHLEPAKLRQLPWPFKYFITLNSDCDSINMEGLINTSKIIREHYGLPVSDSIFPKWLYLRGLKAVGESVKSKLQNNSNVFRNFAEQNFDWLQAYSHGAVDTVHGWIPRMRIKIAKDFSLGCQPRFGPWLEKKLAQPGQGIITTGIQRFLQFPLSRLRRRKKLRFIVPPSWHKWEPPRYLYFEARLPFTGRWFEIHIRTASGISKSVSSTSLSTGMLGKNAYLVDLSELLGTDPRELNDLEVVFELKGGRFGELEVQNPTLLSDTRADIERHMHCMQAFNVTFTTYTSHGGGYDIGRRNSPSPTACDPRIIAELPDNPHYALDLFRDSGMEFFNTASNTSENNIRNINKLVYPNVLNNGTVIYDFPRFLTFSPVDLVLPGESGEAAIVDPSFSEAAGRQIFAALDRMNGSGDGALIYTHFLVKGMSNRDRGDHSVEKMFNSDTHSALAELANRYYGLDGKKGESDRVWIAPTSILLRYSQVIQNIHGHVFYDPGVNTIHVTPWRDYVLGRIVPDLKYGIRELRGITFYVSNAHDAKLFVNEHEFDCLIRNPPDETGQESITIADCESPTKLLGSVLWNERDELKVSFNNIYYSGSQEGIELTLDSNKGEVKIELSGCALDHHQYVAFEYVKSDPLLRFRVDLECDSDLFLAFAEDGFSDLENACSVQAWESTKKRLIVLPYYYLLSALPRQRKKTPSGSINSIRIGIDGNHGQHLAIRSLSLLRDSDLPHNNTCLIGGNTGNRDDIVEICIKWNGQEYRTTPFEDQKFLFPQKFPSGRIYEITGITGSGDWVFPSTGRYIELTGNNLEISF